MLPKVIDLFSGCGGLALGFHRAGFEIVAGIEMMPEACKTISYNLDYRFGKENTHFCCDITKTDASVFKEFFKDEGCIVIGGPPCQAYSMAGRGKLKSLGEHRINTNDSRGYLFYDFLRFVYDLDARVVIMENVPESTNYGDMNIPEIVCQSLVDNGYDAYWTILNSADYGVPQIRERVFVIASKCDCDLKIDLPIPTHKNSDGTKTQYQKRFAKYCECQFFKEPNLASEDCKDWITVKEAFSDLPILFKNINSRYRSVKLNEDMEYSSEPKNTFQREMRCWPNMESYGCSANAFRFNKKDFPIFEGMKQGDNYLDAVKIAEQLFAKEVEVLGYQSDSIEFKNLYSKMVPIYNRDKFENKWRRLSYDRPSHTLVAHLSKDTYSHIHPSEPRGISVREAARLQSFPDDFFFDCSMGDAFKQIGNAVPPLLAYGVAKAVLKAYMED